MSSFRNAALGDNYMHIIQTNSDWMLNMLHVFKDSLRFFNSISIIIALSNEFWLNVEHVARF